MMRRPAVQSTATSYQIPAPVGGLNTVSAGLTLPPTDCVLAYNLISAENGLRARLGWKEWCTELVGVATSEVRTVVPFTGSAPGNGRLFAATETGIYDVTSPSASPTRVLTFGTQTGNAGYGISTTCVTAAGYFSLYCDEVNGYHVYSESGATWAAITQGTGATQIDGVNPANLAFVLLYKGRVWFVERDTANAWYLPPGQIYGTATKFPLAALLREGGTLVGVWSWTYDGGSGLDDSLVAVSTGGDVLVYQGTDPASASTFALRGAWSIGAPPAGRRIASASGASTSAKPGDLLLLSRQGLIPMSALTVGSEGAALFATAKISNLINSIMLTKASERAWGIVQQPEDNALLLLVPQGGSAEKLQLAQAAASRGWFPYRDIPMHSAATWDGKLYFGTRDGRLCVHTGYLDGVTLAGAYEPVSWSLITAYSNLGTPRQKRLQALRALIISETRNASYDVRARYGYDLTELDAVSLVLGGPGTFGTAVFGTDTWGGGYFPSQKVRGASGVGADVAVAIRGTSISRTVLVGIDATYTVGGFL